MARQLKFLVLVLVAAVFTTPSLARDENRGQRPPFNRDGRQGPPGAERWTKPSPGRSEPEELRWVLLGERTVGFNVDKDTIPVGAQEGTFTRLRVEARTNDIYLYTLRVIFANGTQQIVQVNTQIRAGGRTASFNLAGQNQRAIRSITMNYKARPGFAGQTVVSVYGSQQAPEEVEAEEPYGAGPDGYPGQQTQVLDQQTYDRRADRIDFRIPGRDIRLKQITLRAVDESLSLESLEVRYSSGPPQTFNIYDRLGSGEESQPIDIDGERRSVIGVTVIKRPSWRPGQGRVELLGLESQPTRQPPRSSWGVEQGRGPTGWVLFGAQTVGTNVDRDVIDVSQEIGQFSRIALSIRDAEVYLREITLIYADGQRETKQIYASIPANSRTKPIEINGGRFLRQIELVYQSRLGRSPVRAIVEVYGEYDRRWLEDRNGYQNYNRGWLLLGAQRARMYSADEDAFFVGPQFGSFRSLRLTAKRHSVRITGIRITYTNGQVEELPVFKELLDGQSTPNIELGRINRPIERVDVRYRTKLNFQGEGLVELWGTR